MHHVVLFEADSAVSPTPAKCNSGGSLQWRMVTGWAPGGKGFELPPEAGFPLKTTGATHYVVQMHYSNPQALAGQKDHSGFDLCTSPPRQYEADVLAFGTQTINIPAGATLRPDVLDHGPPALAGIHLIASMPHMHKLGTDMSTELFAGGPSGAATDLGTIAGWNFNTRRGSTSRATARRRRRDEGERRHHARAARGRTPPAPTSSSAKRRPTRCVTRSRCTTRGSPRRSGAGQRPRSRPRASERLTR